MALSSKHVRLFALYATVFCGFLVTIPALIMSAYAITRLHSSSSTDSPKLPPPQWPPPPQFSSAELSPDPWIFFSNVEGLNESLRLRQDYSCNGGAGGAVYDMHRPKKGRIEESPYPECALVVLVNPLYNDSVLENTLAEHYISKCTEHSSVNRNCSYKFNETSNCIDTLKTYYNIGPPSEAVVCDDGWLAHLNFEIANFNEIRGDIISPTLAQTPIFMYIFSALDWAWNRDNCKGINQPVLETWAEKQYKFAPLYYSLIAETIQYNYDWNDKRLVPFDSQVNTSVPTSPGGYNATVAVSSWEMRVNSSMVLNKTLNETIATAVNECPDDSPYVPNKTLVYSQSMTNGNKTLVMQYASILSRDLAFALEAYHPQKASNARPVRSTLPS